ncbi:MAG: IclR family transcriptional regulator [Lacisediminihabitans sp.]
MSSVPAARDVLRIVKYLATHSGPVRAATIARDLSLPRSSTYHLLRVLQDEGFLLHSPEYQSYVLSPLVSDIGSSVLGANALATFAQPVLERLVTETRMPVVAHLGVLNHSDVVYASKVSAIRAPAVVTSIGVRLPAHLTATGMAMLAVLPEAQLRAIYPEPSSLVLRAGPGPGTLGELDDILASVRERGWAIEDGEINLEYASVAAAVLDHNGYPAAAIGLTFRGGIVDAQQLRRLGVATVNAATALSKRIRGKI